MSDKHNGVPCVVISDGSDTSLLLMNGQEYRVTLTPIATMTPQQILDAMAEDELLSCGFDALLHEGLIR